MSTSVGDLGAHYDSRTLRAPQDASSSLQNLLYFLLVFPGENFCRVMNVNGIETQKKFKFNYGKSLKVKIQHKD